MLRLTTLVIYLTFAFVGLTFVPRASFAQNCRSALTLDTPIAHYQVVELPENYRWEWLKFNYLVSWNRSRREIDFVENQWRFVKSKIILKGKTEFVMSREGKIYAGVKGVDISSHAAFLRGGPIASGGRLEFIDGRIISIDEFTGHYFSSFFRTGNMHINREQFLTEIGRRGDDPSAFSEVAGTNTLFRDGYQVGVK